MAKDPAVRLREVIGRRFREMTGCDAVVLLAYNETKETFELAATSGAVPILEKPADVAAPGSLARWLRANNDCLVASASPAVTNYLDQAERTLMEQLSVQVCIPLISLTRLSGILLLIGPPGTLASIGRVVLSGCCAGATPGSPAKVRVCSARSAATSRTCSERSNARCGRAIVGSIHARSPQSPHSHSIDGPARC